MLKYVAPFLVSWSLATGVALTPVQAQEAKTVQISYSSCACYLPLIVATKKGYFDEEFGKLGVKVDSKPYNDAPSAIAALASGALDLHAFGSTLTVTLVAKDAGISILAIADTTNSTEGLVAKNDAGIKTVADLKGKRIGVVPAGTSDYALRATLKVHGLKASDVKILPLTPPAFEPAWARGDIDAAYIFDPFLSKLKKDNGHIVETIGELARKTNNEYTIQDFYIGRTDFVRKNPELVRAYGRALSRAVEFIRANKDEIARDYYAELGASDVAEAIEQINGNEFYTLAEQRLPENLGTPGKPGAVVDSLLGVWQFAVENKKISLPPNHETLVKTIDPTLLQ